jgi:broad specificity phosphatase PhoE
VAITIHYETHATSEDNLVGLASGWYDVELAPIGRTQARELGTRYRDVPLDAVISSDLRRAMATAAIAFDGSAVPLHADARLREIDYGTWTRGLSADVKRERHAFAELPFPQGQSYGDVVRAMRALLAEALATWPGGRVLLIGSYAPWAALEHLLGGRALAEILHGERPWQPGWTYRYAAA